MLLRVSFLRYPLEKVQQIYERSRQVERVFDRQSSRLTFVAVSVQPLRPLYASAQRLIRAEGSVWISETTSPQRNALLLAADLLGIADERTIPPFAPQTFRQWFTQRPVKNEGKTKILLWPDTFNNHFFPETAKAAVEVAD